MELSRWGVLPRLLELRAWYIQTMAAQPGKRAVGREVANGQAGLQVRLGNGRTSAETYPAESKVLDAVVRAAQEEAGGDSTWFFQG